MEMDVNLCGELETLQFKYERLGALISCMQTLVSEAIDIAGIPENALTYALYEIEDSMSETNKAFGEIINKARCTKNNIMRF